MGKKVRKNIRDNHVRKGKRREKEKEEKKEKVAEEEVDPPTKQKETGITGIQLMDPDWCSDDDSDSDSENGESVIHSDIEETNEEEKIKAKNSKMVDEEWCPDDSDDNDEESVIFVHSDHDETETEEEGEEVEVEDKDEKEDEDQKEDDVEDEKEVEDDVEDEDEEEVEDEKEVEDEEEEDTSSSSSNSSSSSDEDDSDEEEEEAVGQRRRVLRRRKLPRLAKRRIVGLSNVSCEQTDKWVSDWIQIASSKVAMERRHDAVFNGARFIPLKRNEMATCGLCRMRRNCTHTNGRMGHVGPECVRTAIACRKWHAFKKNRIGNGPEIAMDVAECIDNIRARYDVDE